MAVWATRWLSEKPIDGGGVDRRGFGLKQVAATD
jgi:hypothetical protein